MEIVRAGRGEVAAVDALLRENRLPGLPEAQSLSNLLVARLDGEVIGAIALEVVGRRGLVRSAVVAAARRGAGIGGDLVSSVISRAHELGLRELYLLTETAVDFFAERGFETIARNEVPQEIRATQEFRELCPETAVVMRASLATRL